MRSLALPVSLQCFVALALLLAVPCPTHAITYDLVPVGDAGNAADTTGYGAVAYDYQIGKYDVTIGQYAAFLNAVAKSDPYRLYNLDMANDMNIAGIAQSGSPGNFTYSVVGPYGQYGFFASSENRPITWLTWFSAARFANWMANGQPAAAPSAATTENGAYAINGMTTGSVPVRNLINPNTGEQPTFSIPTENEWYKAAYYSPTVNSGTGGYYWFAMQSNTLEGNVIGSALGQANYYRSRYSVTQQVSQYVNQNYLTDVGAFTASTSYYGTYDQSGNVYQWNDLDGGSSSLRGLRGGSWRSINGNELSSSESLTLNADGSRNTVGFRLAAPVAVTEPSTCFPLAAGLALGCWRLWSRRTSGT
jgi:formylglycine-generating enzyme required for sulfatase activity